jgi:hypothetical protein
MGVCTGIQHGAGKGGYMDYEFYARYDESDRTLEVAWHGGMVVWWVALVFPEYPSLCTVFCLNLFIFRTADLECV